MFGSKPVDIPIDPTSRTKIKEGGTLIDKGRYQGLVGKLIYLAHTRPNIGFAVSMVSIFMNSLTENHMRVVFRILQYLKGNLGRGLYFKKTTVRQVEIYTDAD